MFRQPIAWILLWLVLGTPAQAGVPFWRALCAERILKLDPRLAEEAYGARLILLPPSLDDSRHQQHVPGVLVPHPLRPIPGLTADRDVAAEHDRLEASLRGEMGGLRDLSDKWDEYRFLAAVAPSIAEPESHLASEFTTGAPDPEVESEIQSSVDSEMKKLSPGDPDMAARFLVLERVRRLAHARMGRSILKMRDGFHSEGRLPRTDDDWMGLYARYCRVSKDRVDAALQEARQAVSGSIEDDLVHLPFIEGRTLDRLLADPTRVIIQKMISISKEVRIHVVEGTVLEGASLLRFHRPGSYLTPDEIERVESAVRDRFLRLLPPAHAKFSFTGDVAIEAGSGRITMIDLNPGYTSGYYFAEADLITTHLLARHFTGESTPVLDRIEAIGKAASGQERIGLIREFLTRYDFILRDSFPLEFWDRVIAYQFEEIRRDPTPESLEFALTELKHSGLTFVVPFQQLLAQVQDSFPGLVLPPSRAESWCDHLNDLDPRNRSCIVEGRIRPEAARSSP